MGDENKDDENDEDNDGDEDNNEDAVQESITDNGDEGANNNTAGGNGKPDSGLSESKESSGGRFRNMLEDIEAAAEDVAAEDKVHEVLNRSAQKGTANPPNKHLSGLLLKIGGDLLVRGMSKTQSVRKRQSMCCGSNYTVCQIGCFSPRLIHKQRCYVPKCIPIGDSFENVPPHMHLRFQRLHESAFNGALNTQRSLCEQAGKKLPGKPLPSSKNVVNSSTQLMNSASSGEPQQKGSKGHSSGSLTCSWNVYVELSVLEKKGKGLDVGIGCSR